jgi:hypothetical protein
MRLGLSRPTKAEMEWGRYRSVRGVGKARLDCVGWVKPNRSDIGHLSVVRAGPVGCDFSTLFTIASSAWFARHDSHRVCPVIAGRPHRHLPLASNLRRRFLYARLPCSCTAARQRGQRLRRGAAKSQHQVPAGCFFNLLTFQPPQIQPPCVPGRWGFEIHRGQFHGPCCPRCGRGTSGPK